MTGVISAGGYATASSGETGSRELIRLTKAGDLLVGRPKQSDIELITVDAPGMVEGHVIIRDISHADGSKSLLLAAPESFSGSTKRATIYVKNHSEKVVLLKHDGTSWIRHLPQAIEVIDTKERHSSHYSFLAFPVNGFGSFWLLDAAEAHDTRTIAIPAGPSAEQLLGGGFSRGILLCVCAILLLSLGWAISKRTHKIEEMASK